MKRDDIDFHAVRHEHLAVHELLENWARWVRVRPHGWQVSPMFRSYRPANPTEGWWDRREPRPTVSILEAVEMEKAVSLLPEKHRAAIRWNYVKCSHPAKMARDLCVTKEALADLVNVGRSMLVNRARR